MKYSVLSKLHTSFHTAHREVLIVLGHRDIAVRVCSTSNGGVVFAGSTSH